MSGRTAPDLMRPVRDQAGRYAHPWHVEGGTTRGLGAIMRWQWQRLSQDIEAHPPRSAFSLASPAISERLEPGQLRVTWVGHSTFLIETAHVTILTDPVWSERASPLPMLGPRRLVPAALSFEDLPAIDLVLLSHDHYDHLDSSTIRRLVRRFPSVRWVTPLGYRGWLERRGATGIVELDWWQSTPTGWAAPVTAVPAQHWTKRSLHDERVRLWCAFVLDLDAAGRVYFGGDSGYFEDVRQIGREFGPFTLSLLPIGAYEPRWFMRSAHMDPDEAVRTYLDLGGAGTFGAMHWGTFRLTDEPAFEPPRRLRAAWESHALPARDLWIPAHGETRLLRG